MGSDANRLTSTLATLATFSVLCAESDHPKSADATNPTYWSTIRIIANDAGSFLLRTPIPPSPTVFVAPHTPSATTTASPTPTPTNTTSAPAKIPPAAPGQAAQSPAYSKSPPTIIAFTTHQP